MQNRAINIRIYSKVGISQVTSPRGWCWKEQDQIILTTSVLINDYIHHGKKKLYQEV